MSRIVLKDIGLIRVVMSSRRISAQKSLDQSNSCKTGAVAESTIRINPPEKLASGLLA